MDIQLQFTLTADDYCEFQRGYMRNRKSMTPRSQRGFRSPQMILWIPLTVLLIGYWIATDLLAPPAAAVPPGPPPTLAEALFAFLPYAVMFLLLFGFILWTQRSRYFYRRLALQSMRVGEPRTAEITDARIVIRDAGSTCAFQWNYFIRCVETKGDFLLFTVPRAAQILPKRAFPSPALLEEFRRFAQAHIGNQPIGFPVQPAAAALAPPLPEIPR